MIDKKERSKGRWGGGGRTRLVIKEDGIANRVWSYADFFGGGGLRYKDFSIFKKKDETLKKTSDRMLIKSDRSTSKSN